MKPTDTSEFINSLNAGVFAQQVGRALSDVAAGVVEHGKKGKLTLSFELSRIGESNQVKINHKLDFTQPTKRGSKREDTACSRKRQAKYRHLWEAPNQGA